MKSPLNYLCMLFLLLLQVNCSVKNTREETDSISSESAPITLMADTLALTAVKPQTGRKFIRTAELKFKVQDVAKATYTIENITTRLGGFVTDTNLSSVIDNTTSKAISADSTLETTYFTVSNEMVLRVPNTQLDSTLAAIARLVVYLNYRRIHLDDVGLQLLTNEVKQKRVLDHKTRLNKAIKNRGKKLNETTRAEQDLFAKQESADEANFANLNLTNQVNFSTVQLNIYQQQTFAHTFTPNHTHIKAYEPGFGVKLVDSLVIGWAIVETFILFLLKLWGLFVFLLIAWVLYRKFSSKFKSQQL